MFLTKYKICICICITLMWAVTCPHGGVTGAHTSIKKDFAAEFILESKDAIESLPFINYMETAPQ